MNNVILTMGILVYMSSAMHLQMVYEQNVLEKKALQMDADEAAVSAALTGNCYEKEEKNRKKTCRMVLQSQAARRAAESAVLMNRKKAGGTVSVRCSCSGGVNPSVRVEVRKGKLKADSAYEWVRIRRGKEKHRKYLYKLHKIR